MTLIIQNGIKRYNFKLNEDYSSVAIPKEAAPPPRIIKNSLLPRNEQTSKFIFLFSFFRNIGICIEMSGTIIINGCILSCDSQLGFKENDVFLYTMP